MIWNVTIQKDGNTLFGYQVAGGNINEALENAQRDFHGKVVKIVLSEYDE